MGKVLLLALFAVAVAGLLLTTPLPCKAGSCGIMPIKPIVPIGCRDLVPVCVCDSSGRNCHWTWQCVR